MITNAVDCHNMCTGYSGWFFPYKVPHIFCHYFCALKKKMFYCGENAWHEVYTLDKSLIAQYRVVNYRFQCCTQIPRMYSACLTETLCLLISNPYFTLPPSLGCYSLILCI